MMFRVLVKHVMFSYPPICTLLSSYKNHITPNIFAPQHTSTLSYSTTSTKTGCVQISVLRFFATKYIKMVSVSEIRKAQRAEGPATILAIGTANPANCVEQSTYPDFYFKITNSEHKVELKEKFQRMCKYSFLLFVTFMITIVKLFIILYKYHYL